MSARSPVKNGGSIAAFVHKGEDGTTTTIKEGMLRKQGAFFKTWRYRLFVLTDVALTYYAVDSKKNRVGDCLGKVALADMKSDDGIPIKLLPKIQENPLFAVSTLKRLYLLETVDEDEAYAWIDALRGALQSFHLRLDVTDSAIDMSGIDAARSSAQTRSAAADAADSSAIKHWPLERRGIMASPPSHAAPDPSFTLWHKWIVLKNCCIYVFPSRSAEDAATQNGRLSVVMTLPRAGSSASIVGGSPLQSSGSVAAGLTAGGGGAEGAPQGYERCVHLRDAVCNLNGSGLRFVPPAGEWLELFCQPGADGEAEAKLWGDNVLQARVVSGLCVAAEANDGPGTAQHIEALRSVEVSIDSPDEDARTALFRAARFGSVDAVRVLLEHDADVHSRSGAHGATPLHTAAWHGHLAVAQLLVDHGADPEATSDAGVSALTESLVDTRAESVSQEVVANPLAGSSPPPPNPSGAGMGRASERAVGDDTPMALLLLAAREEKRKRVQLAKEKAREQQRIERQRYMAVIETEKIAALRKFQRRSPDFTYIAPDTTVRGGAPTARWAGGHIAIRTRLSVVDGDALQYPGALLATRPGLSIAARAEIRDGERRLLLLTNTAEGFEGVLSPHVTVPPSAQLHIWLRYNMAESNLVRPLLMRTENDVVPMKTETLLLQMETVGFPAPAEGDDPHSHAAPSRDAGCAEMEIVIETNGGDGALAQAAAASALLLDDAVLYEAAVTWHSTTSETSNAAYRTDGGGTVGVDFLPPGIGSATQKSAWMSVRRDCVTLQSIVKGVLKGEATRLPASAIIRVERADPPADAEMRPVRMRKPNGKLANTIRETYPRSFFAIVARSDAKRGLRRDILEAEMPNEEAIAALRRRSTQAMRRSAASKHGGGLPYALDGDAHAESVAVAAYAATLDAKSPLDAQLARRAWWWYDWSPDTGRVACIDAITMMSERCQGPNFVEAWEPREEGVLAKLDPLLALTARESQRLQKVELLRETAPTAAKLPLYLLATGWERPEQVANAHRMLDGSWAQPETLLDVLPLLDSRLHDGCVRQYASACIERINPTPEDVCRCLPQLVQALKSEHTPAASPLSELLLRRALDAPTTLGLQFFWLLQVEGAAEEEGLRQKERWRRRTGRPAGSQQKRIARDSGIAAPLARAHMPFSALQDEFVRCLGEGELRTIFQRQRKLWSREGFFAGVVHAYQADSSMPSAEENAIVKALPAVPDRLACFIFKVGDDLRQDCLVMQLLNIMDQLWLTQGLDLPLTPYACVSTWNDGGLLQVVPNSKTLADIQKDPLFGGRLTGAWRTSPLSNFLRFNNPTASEFQDAALLFRRSLAGYCVATYLMGIGDRHNDNIMITKGGRLFHIDFGHILGCTKTFKLGKANIKREKTSFVFTREMAACLRQVDGETKDLHEFKKLIANAFNVLRLNSNQLIGLFRAMVPANLPELNSVLDVEYFRRMLQLELSIDEATSYMNKQVDGCLSTSNDFAKSADNWFHIVKQGKAGDERERLKARSQVELARGLTRHPALTQQVVLPFGVSVGRLVPQKCFVLTSAAKPLWLSFEAPEAYDFFDSLDQGRYESFLESGIPPMPDWMVSGGGRIRAASASFDETFASFHAAAGATSEAQKSAKLAIVDDHESAKLAIVDDHEEHNRDYALHHDKIWDAVLDPSSGHYYYVNIADPSHVVWTLPEGTTDEHINYDHGYDEPEAPDEAGYRL